jgi:N-acetylmuramoyl-L-alanine amidase
VRRTLMAWILVAAGLAVALGRPAVPAAGRFGAVVILDPGHGGPDPGAVVSGLLEKHVDFEIARTAAAVLRVHGISVLLTRTSDTQVLPGPWHVQRDLRARAERANQAGGSLLVSIHANTEPTATVSGPIVYWRRGDPASYRLAACLETALATWTGEAHAPRPASHLVLLAAHMPAVTVEVGFLSHHAERAKLATPAWQQRLGQALAAGIERYLSGAH